MSLAVANQYAKALLEIVTKPGSSLAPEAALEQIDAFDALIHASPELRSVLLSPAVATSQKARAIARLGGLIGLHPLLLNFLNVVTSHRRVPLLASIRKVFQSQLDERFGIVRADVAAARELKAEQRTSLEAKLAGVAGQGLRCAYTVDGGLLGGLTVKIGSKVLDGSVRGQLDSLRRRLAAEA